MRAFIYRWSFLALPLVFSVCFVGTGVQLLIEGRLSGLFALLLAIGIPLLVLDGYNAGRQRVAEDILKLLPKVP